MRLHLSCRPNFACKELKTKFIGTMNAIEKACKPSFLDGIISTLNNIIQEENCKINDIRRRTISSIRESGKQSFEGEKQIAIFNEKLDKVKTAPVEYLARAHLWR